MVYKGSQPHGGTPFEFCLRDVGVGKKGCANETDSLAV